MAETAARERRLIPHVARPRGHRLSSVLTWVSAAADARWWLPVDADLTTWDGVLPDPADQYTRYINPTVQQLAASADRRARVLLADPGMGKTFELRAEIERLRAAGAHVVEIDLGEFTESADLREKIRENVKIGAPAAELAVAFDGFDEPLMFDINGLGALIKQELERAGPERLRVLVASRTSLWSAALGDTFISWWGRDQVAHHKFGYYDFSAQIIGVMQWAAEQSGDPLAVAVTSYVRAETFFADGQLAVGRRMLERAADQLSPGSAAAASAVYGSLHMRRQ